MIKYFAVMYPSHKLTNINNAMRVEECASEQEAYRKTEDWKREHPQRRLVVRREVETEGGGVN